MRILNLYAGIGGNRKLWGDKHVITAVELNPNIACVYQDHFPKDKMVVADAHKYLEDHYKEYDFIWSSPPCPSHSRIRNEAGVGNGQYPAIFPDMKLYEEIIFLKHHFKGLWCVENVVSYYKPLIIPQKSYNHYFWTNYLIPSCSSKNRNHFGSIEDLQKKKGFDLSGYKNIGRKDTILRNCVEPEVGKLMLEYAINPIETQQAIDFLGNKE